MSLRHQLALLATCIALVQGCFYDHRVTQAIQARKRRARDAEGAHIASSGGAAPVRVGRVGRVRFYVAADYRRQHPDWQRQLEDLVERANAVLAPEFGTRLEVSELHAWEPRCKVGDLDGCLEEITAIEVTDGREWIVGVLPAQPSFTTYFEELGMANVAEPHFVLRDVSDLAERTAIDHAFPTHTPAQRDDIYAHRKQHKRLAVFLHEWAHAVGALHVSAPEGLLHPIYDDRMKGFDPANASLIHAGLDDAFSPEPGHDVLLAELKKTPADTFLSEERDALLADLEDDNAELAAKLAAGADTAAAEPPSHPFIVKGDEARLLAGLTDDERAAYREAVRLLYIEEPLRSLSVLAPVVKSHPESYAVQHLACGLNMVLGAQNDMQVTCARAQELAVKQ